MLASLNELMSPFSPQSGSKILRLLEKHEILKSLSVLTKCEEDSEDLTFSFGFEVSYDLINHFNATIRCFFPVIISKVGHFIIGCFIWKGCY